MGSGVGISGGLSLDCSLQLSENATLAGAQPSIVSKSFACVVWLSSSLARVSEGDSSSEAAHDQYLEEYNDTAPDLRVETHFRAHSAATRQSYPIDIEFKRRSAGENRT